MPRLIDADELEKEFYDITRLNGASAIYRIQCAPTVDAVEVVRCRDCSWSRERNEYEQKYLIEGVLICTNCEANDVCWNPVFPTHFCSYGERRGD